MSDEDLKSASSLSRRMGWAMSALSIEALSEWRAQAVEAEREACAKVCETLDFDYWTASKIVYQLAAAIRARSTTVKKQPDSEGPS